MRRRTLSASLMTLAAAPLLAGACRPTSGQSASASGGATGQKKDLKKVAVDLQAKNQALIDAINAKADATISRAKTDLQKEADSAEDAVQSETGPVANRINSAVQLIKTGSLSNNLQSLTRANDLLKDAAAA